MNDTQAAYTVDVSGARTQGAGDLTEVARRTVAAWQAEGRRVGEIEGIKSRLERRLAKDREALEKRKIVGDVTGPGELVAPSVAEVAGIGTRSRVQNARCRCLEVRIRSCALIEPLWIRRSIIPGYPVQHVVDTDQVSSLCRSAGPAIGGDGEGRVVDALQIIGCQ